MIDKVKKEALILKILYFIRYFGDSLFYSFFQLYLFSKGLSEGRIGVILAITPITAILANPFWNYMSKDANVNRKIMRIITVIEGLFIIIIGRLELFELLCVLTSLIAVVGSPFYSLFDGYTLTFAENYEMQYSKIRRIGSLAYIFGCSIGGVLVGLIGYSWVFLIAGILFVLSSVLLALLKPLPLEEKIKEKRNYKVVLTNPKFYLYLVFYISLFTIASLCENFLGVFLKSERGITDTFYGQFISIMVLVEFVAMIILGKLGYRIKDYYLYIIVGVLYIARSFAVGFNLPTNVIMLCALLRGVSMGIILHIHLNHLRKIVGIENLTAGILIIAIVSSTVLALGNILCGHFIEIFSYQNVFMVLGIITLISLTIYVIRGIIFKEYKKIENK